MRAIVVLALLGSALALSKTSNRIIGGAHTTVEVYPYMANMQHGYFGISFRQRCGGVLITKMSVLSAAHCYEDEPVEWWRVVLGTSSIATGGTIFNVDRVTFHPLFSSNTLDNDVAIVRLGRAAVYSNIIKAAYIAGTNYPLRDGSPIIAVGWGFTSSIGFASTQLRHVTLDVINQEVCAERYAFLKTLPGYTHWPDITSNMFCAGILDVGGRDACQGDAGGPMTVIGGVGHVVVGIISWGFECAHSYYPGVAARISRYANWIVANA